MYETNEDEVKEDRSAFYLNSVTTHCFDFFPHIRVRGLSAFAFLLKLNIYLFATIKHFAHSLFEAFLSFKMETMTMFSLMIS